MVQRDKEPPPITLEELVNPLLNGVDRRIKELLLSKGQTRRFAPGDFVLQEEEPSRAYFLLHRGSVRVFYRAPTGLEVVVKLFRSPAAFGEMECLVGIPYLETVQAVEKTTLLEIPRADFLDALGASPALTRNLLEDVAARLCISAQHERSLAFHPVETRLANLLSTYVDFYGLPVADGIKIRIPLTQDDLANGLGVARRSVTRTLARWADEGMILKQGRHFVVVDPAKLSRVTDPTLLRIGYRIGMPLRKGEL